MEPGVLTLKMISSLPPFLWTTRTKFRHTEPLIVKNLKWKYFPLHGHYYSFEIKLNRCFICVYSSLEQCFHNHQKLLSTSIMFIKCLLKIFLKTIVHFKLMKLIHHIPPRLLTPRLITHHDSLLYCPVILVWSESKYKYINVSESGW